MKPSRQYLSEPVLERDVVTDLVEVRPGHEVLGPDEAGVRSVVGKPVTDEVVHQATYSRVQALGMSSYIG